MRSVVLTLLLALAARAPAAAGPAPAPADTVPSPNRIARRFPEIEVRAPLHDVRSSQTVQIVSREALRSLPIDGLADVLALQPGVVARGEELHVRGGRSGETTVQLEGMRLSEPRLGHALELPLLALREVELVTGAPEANLPGSLAGTLVQHTLDPGERFEGEWRWQTSGAVTSRDDRVAARASAPLHVLGLGAVLAGDATLNDGSLPALRSASRRRVAGLSFGWRAENRLAGFLKLAPVAHPHAFSLQLAADRHLSEPYDPQWSIVRPGYRAADHLAITDERRQAVLLSVATPEAARRVSLALGWLRTRSLTGAGGSWTWPAQLALPVYGGGVDAFHVLAGDEPFHSESRSDELSLRTEADVLARNWSLHTGAEVTYDDVALRELDRAPDVGSPFPSGLDELRSYHATAPGASAWVQHRWQSGGLVLNSGLRAEYWTAGPQAAHQSLPGGTGGTLLVSPRLGIAYPISDRDVFSLAYVRLQQPPLRDQLYDNRLAISNHQPLGNAALGAATAISYEASTKHLFDVALAMQLSVFYRDLYGEVGARDTVVPNGARNLVYADADEGQAAGIEWSLLWAPTPGRHAELRYTWMQAWGSESKAEGEPYGTLRGTRVAPVGDTPLSWDRRHTLAFSGATRVRGRWSVSWSTQIGSPLPWTPKPLDAPYFDYATVNSARLGWSETTNLDVGWTPPFARALALSLEVRNLFDNRAEQLATLDGYPNPTIDTVVDSYGSYRTATGLGGGGYLVKPPGGTPYWVAVHDPRLFQPPRVLRLSIGSRW